MAMWHRRKLYPPNWKERAYAFKASRGFVCEYCHVKQGEERVSLRTGNLYRVWLHAAHKRLHETLDEQAELLCLCPSCHGRYDYEQRTREWVVRLEILKHRAHTYQRLARTHPAFTQHVDQSQIPHLSCSQMYLAAHPQGDKKGALAHE